MRFNVRAFLQSLYEPTATVQLAKPESVDDVGRWARQAAALLATVDDPDRRADLREVFEHRAGVCEFDGELPRDDAERMAFDELQDTMHRAGELA